MREKPFKVAPNRRQWYGFNLLQGHVFGIYEGVPYVSNAVLGPRPGTIYAYKCTQTPDCYHWGQTVVSASSELGRQIIKVQAVNPYGGARPMHESIEKQVEKLLPSRITSGSKVQKGNPYKPYQGGSFTPK